MGKKLRVEVVDYGLMETRVASMLVMDGEGRSKLVELLAKGSTIGRGSAYIRVSDGRYYKELQAECVKVSELVGLSGLSSEEFVEFVDLVECDVRS